MWASKLFRGLTLIAMILPAVLTTSAVLGDSRPEPTVTKSFPLQTDAAVAEVYTRPHERIPAATGVLRSDSPSFDDSTDWVALRSPTAADQDASSARHRYSPRGLNRWKGKRTRYRTLSELRLAVDDYGIDNWVYPIDEKHIAGSPFGRRRDPITHQRRNHNGQDIGCRTGTPIYAVADGTVTRRQNSRSAGRYVDLEHPLANGESLTTRYLHLSRRMVSRGEEVQAGQQIGRCGSTGASVGPHLHFEVKKGERALVPFTVYPQLLAGEEAEKRAWDAAIALAVEQDTVSELLDGESVPREVLKIVAEYRRARGKKEPRLLSSASRPEVERLLAARGGLEQDDDDAADEEAGDEEEDSSEEDAPKAR